MRLSSILGINARNKLFALGHNSYRTKNIARSKILTKRVLARQGVVVPEVYKVFKDTRDVFLFNWAHLPSSFALKPSKGMGGEGIIVVKKKSLDGEGWITTQRKKVTADDLQLHTLDILEGAYSIGSVPDIAFCEEYIGRHKAFRKLAFRGTPDIRVIVFNKVPVMAMLRLPTKDSGGRANLHQGAIGVGVDIATGITTHAVWYGESIVYKPGTKRKLNGVKIPQWTRVLETAVRAQVAAGLGYLGVDIVLHSEKGPVVLEINSSPGLEIQLANLAGLRKRLERVDDLQVADAEHGVYIAKALFSSPFARRVRSEDGVKTISVIEEVAIVDKTGRKHKALAKIDTGARSSSVDRSLAEQLGLTIKGNIVGYRPMKSSFGMEERPFIAVAFWLAGRKIYTTCSLANRKHLAYKMIIGRRDLQGFLVNLQKGRG